MNYTYFCRVNFLKITWVLSNAQGYYKKQSYEDLLKQKVWEKYGMKNTFLYTAKDEKKLPVSTDAFGKNTDNWEFKSFDPAWGIVSSIEDWVLYAKAHLDTSNKELMLMRQSSIKIDSNTERTKYIVQCRLRLIVRLF